ncbi:MAG TPA: O-antigen ligase family protein [Methylomirabilota bacterium]|nr:O-antigen ligase family protein [Methylomirabilota bacterium]
MRGLPLLFDRATECLLYVMIVFSPWAFGTTEPWSVRLMNFGGYVLGILLLAKWTVRRRVFALSAGSTRRFSLALLCVIGLILAYILTAALNAEFTHVRAEFRQDPHPHVDWLPHSLDRLASWQFFQNWLALACIFWAVHDWIMNDSTLEGNFRTRRLRRLIFVLAINGALVALEGILQRSSGTARLLWFRPTHDNPTAAAQFGPYAYRANAAQLFNLIWPPALALWWHLHLRPAPSRPSQRHHWLLPAVVLLVVASLVSMSRGGVVVTLLELCACGCLFFAAGRFSAAVRWKMGAAFLVTMAVAWYFGGDGIAERFHGTSADPLGGRRESYQLAEQMTHDYPWFGIGPGAFTSVFQVYRNSPGDYWPAQLHNDWLEFLITFGRLGCALLVVAAGLIAARWWRPGGLRLHWTFAAFVWIAIGGCLLHARFDFPLQIYSIQFVCVLLAAVLFSLSRVRSGG